VNQYESESRGFVSGTMTLHKFQKNGSFSEIRHLVGKLEQLAEILKARYTLLLIRELAKGTLGLCALTFLNLDHARLNRVFHHKTQNSNVASLPNAVNAILRWIQRA